MQSAPFPYFLAEFKYIKAITDYRNDTLYFTKASFNIMEAMYKEYKSIVLFVVTIPKAIP